jgi:hypothetical protein
MYVFDKIRNVYEIQKVISSIQKKVWEVILKKIHYSLTKNVHRIN